MIIKRYRIVLASVAVLVLIACIAAIYYTNLNKSIPNQSIDRESEFMYYLKEHEQKIGVYKTNEDSPFMTIDVYVSTLPYVDRVELTEGVKVLDDNNLRQIIEDYES